VADESEIRPGTPVERYLRRKRLDEERGAARVDRSRLQRARTVEDYLTGSMPPRWMERLADIERGIARERRRLERVWRELGRECAGDPEAFASRWRQAARSWSFDEGLNDLIREHNEWFPVERQLAIDPRTRDYVLINGKPYRRPVLDADWALEAFPGDLSKLARDRFT
jgi:hypothetical protein